MNSLLIYIQQHLAMYEVFLNGGLAKGGINFDAKVRRASFEPDDLFYAHILVWIALLKA